MNHVSRLTDEEKIRIVRKLLWMAKLQRIGPLYCDCEVLRIGVWAREPAALLGKGSAIDRKLSVPVLWT